MDRDGIGVNKFIIFRGTPDSVNLFFGQFNRQLFLYPLHGFFGINLADGFGCIHKRFKVLGKIFFRYIISGAGDILFFFIPGCKRQKHGKWFHEN